MESLEKKTAGTHSITDKVIQLLKKNPQITNQEIAEQLGLKNEQVASGWRAVAEDTMNGWKRGY